jgi:hypothetical protein
VKDAYADDPTAETDLASAVESRSLSRVDAPAAVALALAVGHLIEAAVDAHRIASHAEVARRLSVSEARVSRLSAITALAPEIQSEILALRAGDPLGKLSERTVLELCASRPSWNVQRWWWSLLAQPVDPNWLAEWVPPRTEFPSGKRARHGDRAIGDLSLDDLAELVARRRGHRDTPARREALLAALVEGGERAPAPYPDVILALAMPAAKLAAAFERLHSRRPPTRYPTYLRRRVAWAVQAAKLGGLPKPIGRRVMELKEHLPDRWQEAFAGVARVHVTRVHRVERTPPLHAGS